MPSCRRRGVAQARRGPPARRKARLGPREKKGKKAKKDGSKDDGIIWAPPEWEDYLTEPAGLAMSSAGDVLVIDFIAAAEAGVGEALFANFEAIRADLIVDFDTE